MRILLIFIDGFGLGELDRAINPLAHDTMLFWQELFGGPLTKELGFIFHKHACLVPTDATLGIDGLPQSATGQTAIFTGQNAAAIMGRHVQAFPGPALAAIIKDNSIMKQLVEKGLCATSANFYSPDYMDLVAKRKRRHSASTLTILAAGQALRSYDEMIAGKAVYQDVTNSLLPVAAGVPQISAKAAGERLVRIAAENHFTMFEYFQTDRVGHKQNWEYAFRVMQVLDEFLRSVYQAAEREDITIIITSDHGNFEDLHCKTHTYNAVPTIVTGSECQEIAEKIISLTDVTPVIISMLERNT